MMPTNMVGFNFALESLSLIDNIDRAIIFIEK